MSRLLKITDNGNGILVQGTDNILYPDNATLTFPYNSIILVTDESDIATFRSASNNDVLFSGLIGNIEIGSTTVTKANIIEKFDEIANQESGGGGEPFDPTDYYTKSQTNALLDEKADESDIANFFDGAEYDSQTKRINFKHGNTVKAYIDATAFIKDGMVDTVAISNGNLVITFNTDAGKQPISIPLTDIFNPANYYDKTASDQRYAQISSLATVATSGSYNDLSNKPTIPAAQVNSDWNASSGVAQILNKPDLSVYAQSSSLATVATSGDYVDLINKPTIPTVPTNVSAFTNDAGYLVGSDLADYQPLLTAGTNITIDANNVISATGGGTAQVQSDWNQTNTSAVDYIKNKPTIPVVPTNVSAFTNDAGYLTQHQSLANYYTKSEVDAELDTKQDISDAFSGDYNDLTNKPTIPDVSNYYTKTESDNKYLTNEVFDAKEETISAALNELDTTKQDVLTAGANITITNNVISATGGGTQVQSDWTQSDTTAVDYIKNKPELATVATSGSYNDLTNKPTIPDVSDYVEKSVYNQKEIAVAEALTDLNENKADKTDVYSKSEVDSAIETALEDIDLSGYVDKATFDIKEEVISTALNQLDNKIGDINTLLEGI